MLSNYCLDISIGAYPRLPPFAVAAYIFISGFIQIFSDTVLKFRVGIGFSFKMKPFQYAGIKGLYFFLRLAHRAFFFRTSCTNIIKSCCQGNTCPIFYLCYNTAHIFHKGRRVAFSSKCPGAEQMMRSQIQVHFIHTMGRWGCYPGNFYRGMESL